MMEITTTIGLILHRKGSEVYSVSPTDTVFDAISLMSKHNIGALPVINGTRLVGMLSERDYARKVALLGRVSRETAVADIMTRDVLTVSPQDTVHDCMEMMTQNRIRHLPVIEDGKMLGLISIGDVVNWTIGAQDAAIHDLENYVTGAYPA